MEAATIAMTGDQEWLATRNEVYKQRRDLILETLYSSGLMASTPRASLYIWCPVPQGWTTKGFTTSLLERAHISLTPGTLFGQNGEGFVRISLTAPVERITQAMRRFTLWIEQCHSAF
jgi:LL-diaminopimelate aminotransferase